MRVALAATLLSCLTACQVADSFEPPQGGLQRMIEQPRYDPFEASRFFDDGLTMRHPPEGAVLFAPGSSARELESGVESGSFLARSPLAVTSSLLALGRERYDVVCATCHGVLGTAETPVARNMELRPPPSLVTPPISDYLPGRLFEIASRGYGFMPGYSMMLSSEERWAIVAYLEALTLSQSAFVGDLPRHIRAQLSGATP